MSGKLFLAGVEVAGRDTFLQGREGFLIHLHTDNERKGNRFYNRSLFYCFTRAAVPVSTEHFTPYPGRINAISLCFLPGPLRSPRQTFFEYDESRFVRNPNPLPETTLHCTCDSETFHFVGKPRGGVDVGYFIHEHQTAFFVTWVGCRRLSTLSVMIHTCLVQRNIEERGEREVE